MREGRRDYSPVLNNQVIHSPTSWGLFLLCLLANNTCLGKETSPIITGFIWLMGIWTQVPILAWQAFFLTAEMITHHSQSTILGSNDYLSCSLTSICDYWLSWKL